MSILSQIKKPEARAPIITVVGDAGTGKTSLASSFPKPVFIRVEDGIGRIAKECETPDAFPVVKSEEQLKEQLRALLTEEHDYQTLVIDSITALDTIFSEEIMRSEDKTSLAKCSGGYGAGYEVLSGKHATVRKAVGFINEKKGMNIVFIAHADLETMSLPDTDDYKRYSVKIHKKSVTHYVDNVDVVGYVRLQSALKGNPKDDAARKKVVSNGDREFVCHATAASVSKNGFGITEAIEFAPGENPLAPHLVSVKKVEAKAKVEPEAETEVEEYEG